MPSRISLGQGGGDSQFRYCVHCGVDCEPDEADQEHAANCPMVTGMWPVEVDPALELAKWVRWECDSDVPAEVTGHAEAVLAKQPHCDECSTPLSPGDVYALRSLATGRVEARPVGGMVICLGCAFSTPETDAHA